MATPVLCRDALARRDELVEKLGSLPAIPTPLDQIVQHCGTGSLAEITCRSRGIVRRDTGGPVARFTVESRPGSANRGETRAFMNDEKQILIFSDAGGTGCSYHAERSALNQRLRVYYLLEAGWRAETVAAGIYDKGLETIAADSMQITERRFAYTHSATGAQSHLLAIEQKQRNRPMTLDDVQALAIRDQRATLMTNGKSGRPAVMVPTRSMMLDDGSIRPRVVLIRPMDEPRYEVRQLEETNRDEADETAFDAAWEADNAKVAAFSTATLHVVTGLLLSIWRLLPQDSRRVYRLQSDDGERIVGRVAGCVVAPSELSRLCRNLGIDHVETITSDHAWRLTTDGSSIVGLAGNITLRWVRVMNDHRVERTGFTDGMREWLTVIGLFSGIIAWKTRFFVPMTGGGPAILSRLMDGHRLVDVVVIEGNRSCCPPQS